MPTESSPNPEANSVAVVAATPGDLQSVYEFLTPFMEQKLLLSRTLEELEGLLRFGFVAKCKSQTVGFAALEIYSKKLAELQCLAVSGDFRRMGIGRILVKRCVETATAQGVLELMAISNSADLFQACGFDYSLPNQKRALFIEPQVVKNQELD